MKTKSPTGWWASQAYHGAIMALSLLAAHSASAATEHWLGVPGSSASLNWTDANNWSSPQQTWYNEVQFAGVGANPNTDFSTNNVLDATTGVAQMPIWRLDYLATNGNYTTLINPGVTLTLGAGYGALYVGANALDSVNPAPADAAETVTITGQGGALTMSGGLYVIQGSAAPGDLHNITLNLSGLDNFNITGGSDAMVGSGGAPRTHGTLYLARTNQLNLNSFQICNQAYSNSVACAVYLGQTNAINLGGGNLIVGGTGTSILGSGTPAPGAFMKFNPAFVGGANPLPGAYFAGTSASGRITNFWIGNGNGGANVPGYSLCDFTGGNITMLVGTMLVGQSGIASSQGVLSFDNGLINADNATVGSQAVSSGGAATGIVNLGTNATFGANATLRVNNTLTLGGVSGTATAGTAGTINVNGGALVAGAVANGGGVGTINMAGGSMTVLSVAGTPASPISSLAVTNSVLNLAVLPTTNSVVVSSLKTGGAGNVINIVSAPPMASYPTQVVLIKYSGSIGGAGNNFALGTLPALYAGHLVNNTQNGSVDVVLTSGSGTLTWKGNNNGNWDTSTANWSLGGSVVYADGQFVQFLDGANTGTVNLTAGLMPGSVTVSNTALSYVFGGSGSLGGSGGLIKSGSGTLVLDNSGANSFAGGVTVNAGALQVGNNDSAGNIPSGSLVDNGSLVFARSDSVTVGNSISGTGSLTQAGAGGTLLLSGGNTFAGNLLVTNGSTLQLGGGSASGASSGILMVASGATLDINGNASTKPIVVAGSGVNGNGAIVDNGGAVYGVGPSVTLSGDTTFNMSTRWDVGAVLSTGGKPYNLSLMASGYFEWKNVAVDAALGNINLLSGSMGVVGTTTFGNPNATLALYNGSALVFYGGPYSVVSKQVDFQPGAVINCYGGNNIMTGTMNLESGYCPINVSGGTSLNISNVLSGSGIIYQNGGTGSIILSGNSPSYTAGVTIYSGRAVINGTIGGRVTSRGDSTVAGSGTVNALVDVGGALVPGEAGVPGTFHAAGGLVLEGGAALTNDLSSSPSGNNDLTQVTGDLTVNGNMIYINPIGGALASGTYTLLTYTGNLNGSFGGVATVLPSSYSFVLNNVTTTNPKQIQVVVSGSQPNSLVWDNAAGNGEWDLQFSANWSNRVTHASSVQFQTLDAVLFDDSSSATNVDIASGQSVMPSALTVNSSESYTIGGAGQISGGGTITKQGTGALTLNTASGFNGAVTVSGGTLKTSGATLASAGSIVVTNGATLDFTGTYMSGSIPVTISGAGVGGKGALFNSGGGIYGNVMSLMLAADATVGGSSRWDLGSGAVISGAHNLTVDLSAGAGYCEWDTVSVATNVINVTLTGGNFGAKNMTAGFQNPATLFTLDTNRSMTFWSGGWNGSLHICSNAEVDIYTAPAAFGGKSLILDQNAKWYSWGGSGDQSFNNAVTLNGVVRFLIGNHNLIYTNVISGPGGFVADAWDHQFVFSAVNTYTGPTVIGDGPQVALVGNGSIASSALIFFGGGNTNSVRLDASARVDKALTLATGQTLAGIGTVAGNLVVSAGATLSPAGTNTTIGITTGSNPTGGIAATNNVTLNGTTIIKLNGNGVNDVVKAGGSLTYGGTLNLINISAAGLAAGNSFQVFSAGSYSGSFSSVAPATPGAGLAWDLSQLSSGIVKVVSGVVARPVINSTKISGSNLIFSGTNGVANSTFHVYTSTSVSTPLANWTLLTNGVFDANGSFSVTNAVGTNPRQFYLLRVP